MRPDFFKTLYEHMERNPKIWALTGDLGYGGFDRIRDDFPKRFLNTGAAEQALMDIAVGLALSGKSPVVYSITPFLLYRPFETIRTYIDHEHIPVIMVGSGRDKDYAHDGFSHDATDDRLIMRNMYNVSCYWPESATAMRDNLREAINNRTNGSYINLKR